MPSMQEDVQLQASRLSESKMQHWLQQNIVGYVDRRVDEIESKLERFECAQELRADAASMYDELKALVAAQEKRIDTIETALMSVKLEYDTAQSAMAEQMKRMDAAEKALSSLRYEGNKLQPVDVQCTALDVIQAHANTSVGTPKLEVEHRRLDVAMRKSRHCEHILEESVYEAMLLVGISELGAMGSCLIVLSFVLNVGMQLIFSIIVQDSFLTDVLPEPESIERWRITDAHSYSYIGSSGASLVSRICNGDASLSVGQFQQQLLQEIHDYVDSNINLGGVAVVWWSAGTTLCGMVLFVWLFCVLQEVLQTMSCIKALWLQPRGPTHLKYDHDTVRIGSVGSRSLLGMTMVMLLRFGLALVLLYQGALWLAKTPEIRELVLNACALSFVLDLDQLLFYTFVPLRAKLLVRTMDPLKTQWGPHWRGTGVMPIVNLITSLLFVALAMYSHAIPLLQQMRDIEYELCHGNVDFVYTNADDRHFGVIHAADSPAYEASRSTFTEVAVQDVIKIGSPSLSEMVLFWPDLQLMQISAGWSTGEFSEMASVVRGCSDYGFQSSEHLYLMWTLHGITGHTTARNCNDLRGFCSLENGLVRMACPETCGCSLPRSGLFRNAYSRGCPVQVCLASQSFQAGLAAIPCEDPSSHQLRDLAGWPRWLEEFRDAMSDFSPEGAGAWKNISENFLKHGCVAIRDLPLEWQESFCFGNSISTGMQAFCPVECGCVNSSLAACPPACRRNA